MRKPRILIGAAFAIGGASVGNRRAPFFLRSHYLAKIKWRTIVWQAALGIKPYPDSLNTLHQDCLKLSHHLQKTQPHFLPIIIGGDHSCAIGTWQGLATPSKKIALLWIDAHFDSHTPDTSASQRLHGMPLAVLLGQGDKCLLWHKAGVIETQHSVVFGVRSFEAGEAELLQQLGVRYYTMNEIKQRGFYPCFNEAWRTVSSCQSGFGLSIDLDAIDPVFAPAVSVKEPHGLNWPRLLKALSRKNLHQLKAVELVEFNPYAERQGRTLKLIKQLLRTYTR